MDNLAQVLTKYRTSTLIGRGLNSHMMKSCKLICAQLLKMQNLVSYRETKSFVQSAWNVSVYVEVTNYKKYLFFFYGIILADMYIERTY